MQQILMNVEYIPKTTQGHMSFFSKGQRRNLQSHVWWTDVNVSFNLSG